MPRNAAGRVAVRPSRGAGHPFQGLIVGLVCLASVLLALGGSAAEAPPTKRVLMLLSEGKDLPVNVKLERAAKAELAAGPGHRIEFYAEHLDASRFPGESYYKLFC